VLFANYARDNGVRYAYLRVIVERRSMWVDIRWSDDDCWFIE